MNQTEQIFEEARSAGIDLDLVDANLALSVDAVQLPHWTKSLYLGR
ncbi:MAG: hypothetical protein IPP19_04090 [Verrucomicrobia bacterium]|nr:hypothetical protein [Verrucomicrobiota bacterium]